MAFAEFEQDLGKNLQAIQKRIDRSNRLFRDVDPGKAVIRPKSVQQNTRIDFDTSMISVPDGQRGARIDEMSVRLLLEPSPEFALCEVVWLRKFGPALDALLAESCLANRLKLHASSPPIPIHTRNLFEYWAPAYKKFRSEGLEVAKWCLQRGTKHCRVVVLDLTSYYDNIDPDFLLTPSFCQSIVSNAKSLGIPFDLLAYRRDTKDLIEAFRSFWRQASELVGVENKAGIPIGSLTSRLIANLALIKLDQRMRSRPHVAYYARYVDDIIIVEQVVSEKALTSSEVVARLLPLDPHRSDANRSIVDEISLGRRGSSFVIQNSKLRVFDLHGEAGVEYISSIESELKKVSSERRRFLEPNREDIDEPIAASPRAEPIRVLREADALSLRKLTVGLVAEKVITAAAMLPATEARAYSRKYLGKAGRLATDQTRWVELLDVSFRMLGSALLSFDAFTSNEMISAILDRARDLTNSRRNLFPIRWGSTILDRRRAAHALRDWVESRLVEIICGASPFSSDGFLIRKVKSLDEGIRLRLRRISRDALLRRAVLLAAADLRVVDRETDASIGTSRGINANRDFGFIQNELSTDAEFHAVSAKVVEFLSACSEIPDSCYGNMTAIEVLLMFRSPTYASVLLCWVRSNREVSRLADIVNAVRGTKYSASPMEIFEERILVDLPARTNEAPGGVGVTRVVLGNLSTDPSWWADSLEDPNCSIERLGRVARVLNQAAFAARIAEGPALLVLPELSIPRRWLLRLCEHLSRTNSRLALVAGIEYDVVGKDVYNETIGFLPHDYFASSAWIWTKRRPAPHEASELVKLGFRFATRHQGSRFAVIHSAHGAFIPLICSELLEVDTRAQLLKKVDLVLVPAWNQDTSSFESLVHSTSLELHCFVAVANNGLFSDCRIRGPYAEPWQRDACRLISRGENEVVFADLPIDALREYRQDPSGYVPDKNNPARRPKWKPAPPDDSWPT